MDPDIPKPAAQVEQPEMVHVMQLEYALLQDWQEVPLQYSLNEQQVAHGSHVLMAELKP